MKKEEFVIGQRVKTWDNDDSCFVYGHVKEITGEKVVIDWNDLGPTDHFDNSGDFYNIKIGNPESFKIR